MKLASLITAAACLGLSACASLPPSSAEMAKLPVIRFGQPLPKGNDYIILFPGGTPLPVTTVVDGSLFEQGGQSTLHVVLNHDMYGYRQFASLDGKHWVPSRKLVETRLSIKIPEKDGPNAGLIHLQMDRK